MVEFRPTPSHHAKQSWYAVEKRPEERWAGVKYDETRSGNNQNGDKNKKFQRSDRELLQRIG